MVLDISKSLYIGIQKKMALKYFYNWFLNILENFIIYQIEQNLQGHITIVIAHEGDGENNCKLSVVQRVFKSPEKAKDRLKELFDLAFKYPNEVMIVKLESKLSEHSKNNGTLGWNVNQVAQKMHNLLVELRADQRAIVFQENNTPTLGWCRENKKNVMITIEPREEVIDNLIHYTHYSYSVSAQVDWQTDPLDDVKSGEVIRGERNKNNGMIFSPFLEIHLNPENALKLLVQTQIQPL